jgi:multiple sugar transport system substrate-binding protein
MAVAIPFGPVDAISSFLTVADNINGKPFENGGRVVSDEVGKAVMSALRELLVLCDPASYDLTPVTLMERMSTTDTLVYTPLEYGYNNYARPGYRKHLCRYANIPALGDDGPRGSHIGGTGIAVSTGCKHPQVAADYALKCASGTWQKTIYFDAGGQPGHAAAWEDERVNQASSNFFRDTRETIERAYLRPRYDGYIKFQYPAGALIRECVRDNGDVPELLKKLDRLYQETLPCRDDF